MLSWISPLFAVFKKSIMAWLIRAGLAASGPLNWIVSFIVTSVLSRLQKALEKALIKLKIKAEVKKETEKELKKYTEEIEKPNATPEEIRKAGKDFLES